MQALQGKLDKAWVTLEKAKYLSFGPKEERLTIGCLVDIGFGEILLERNSLSKAQTYLEQGIQAAGSLWWLSNLDGMISLARLRQIQGDFSGAQSVIADASRLSQDTESNQWDDPLLSTFAIRLALQWWRKSGFPAFMGILPLQNYPYHVYEYIALTQSRLLTTMAFPCAEVSLLLHSLSILDPLLIEAQRFQRVSSQIEIYILKAINYYALGKTLDAVSSLINALILGEPEGYIRIFLDGGKPLSDLLHQCRINLKKSSESLPTTDYVDHLISSFKAEKTTFQSAPPARFTSNEVISYEQDGISALLSTREREVLGLIAQGKSNKEISIQLFLALNTVKRHVYNIFTKLGVKNRTQAVSKAQSLKLI
jgi:LuxR family maltose regulon positive regulatory protein